MRHSSVAIPEFLDLDLLARLGGMEVQARFLVQGFLTGMHRSPLRGFNVEFKEYRAYQQGDEPRSIDWKVYARTDRLQTKVREEDTNLTAYLLLDASASMNYRSPKARMTKWDYARSMAAAMLLLLGRQHDAASVAIVGDGQFRYIAPSLKACDQQRMLSAMAGGAAGRQSTLAADLAQLATLTRRRSLVFVISDFYVPAAELDGPIGLLRHGECEPILLHVLDPMELDFEFDSPVLLEELESLQRIPLSPDLLRRQYLGLLQKHMDELARTVRGYGGQYQLVRTDELPYRALGTFLARRGGML